MAKAGGLVFLLVDHYARENNTNNYKKSSDRSANDGNERRSVITAGKHFVIILIE